MKQNDYFVSIEGVINRKDFFAELLTFYAKQDIILTTWGKLPSHIHKSLDQFKSPSPRIRRLFFNESNWFLNNQSLYNLTQHLCDDHVLENLTWGLVKKKTGVRLNLPPFNGHF